ncbi:hypothetical protein BJ165DRAFT_1409163 [Panaeolus papilionaceus]|nr:hypothetical protein BJ165DRAFT_1409163 [Panaeolus papilionaceus]
MAPPGLANARPHPVAAVPISLRVLATAPHAIATTPALPAVPTPVPAPAITTPVPTPAVATPAPAPAVTTPAPAPAVAAVANIAIDPQLLGHATNSLASQPSRVASHYTLEEVQSMLRRIESQEEELARLCAQEDAQNGIVPDYEEVPDGSIPKPRGLARQNLQLLMGLQGNRGLYNEAREAVRKCVAHLKDQFLIEWGNHRAGHESCILTGTYLGTCSHGSGSSLGFGFGKMGDSQVMGTCGNFDLRIWVWILEKKNPQVRIRITRNQGPIFVQTIVNVAGSRCPYLKRFQHGWATHEILRTSNKNKCRHKKVLLADPTGAIRKEKASNWKEGMPKMKKRMEERAEEVRQDRDLTLGADYDSNMVESTSKDYGGMAIEEISGEVEVEGAEVSTKAEGEVGSRIYAGNVVQVEGLEDVGMVEGAGQVEVAVVTEDIGSACVSSNSVAGLVDVSPFNDDELSDNGSNNNGVIDDPNNFSAFPQCNSAPLDTDQHTSFSADPYDFPFPNPAPSTDDVPLTVTLSATLGNNKLHFFFPKAA